MEKRGRVLMGSVGLAGRRLLRDLEAQSLFQLTNCCRRVMPRCASDQPMWEVLTSHIVQHSLFDIEGFCEAPYIGCGCDQSMNPVII